MARIFNRVEQSVKYQAGSMVSAELSRNYHVMQYLLEIEVITTNSGTPKINNNNLFAAINNLELVADGNQNIKQVPAAKFVLNNLITSGRQGKSTLDLTVGSGKKQSAFCIVDMIIPNEIRPMDTVLNTRMFQTLFMNISWADANALGAGVTITDATLKISSQQIIGYIRNKDENIAFYKEVATRKHVTADNSEYLVQMPVQKFYQGFFITCEDNGVLKDGVIQNIKIKSGTTIFINQSASTVQRFNELDFRLQKSENTTGIYYIDFTPRGRLTDMLDTMSQTGFNTLEIELDVKGTTQNTYITVFSDYIEFIPQKEQA